MPVKFTFPPPVVFVLKVPLKPLQSPLTEKPRTELRTSALPLPVTELATAVSAVVLAFSSLSVPLASIATGPLPSRATLVAWRATRVPALTVVPPDQVLAAVPLRVRVPAPALVRELGPPLLLASVSAIEALSGALVTVMVLARSSERASEPAPRLVMLKPETSKVRSSKVLAVVTSMASGVPELASKTASSFWVQTTPASQFSLPETVLQLLVRPVALQVSAAWARGALRVRTEATPARRAAVARSS